MQASKINERSNAIVQSFMLNIVYSHDYEALLLNYGMRDYFQPFDILFNWNINYETDGRITKILNLKMNSFTQYKKSVTWFTHFVRIRIFGI